MAIGRAAGVALLSGAANASMKPSVSQCAAETLVTIGDRTFMSSGTGVVEVASAKAYCTSCHDGVIATFVSTRSRDGKFRRSSGSLSKSQGVGASHPVDVPYPDGHPGYVSRGLLGPLINLPRSDITCSSCHPKGETTIFP